MAMQRACACLISSGRAGGEPGQTARGWRGQAWRAQSCSRPQREEGRSTAPPTSCGCPQAWVWQTLHVATAATTTSAATKAAAAATETTETAAPTASTEAAGIAAACTLWWAPAASKSVAAASNAARIACGREVAASCAIAAASTAKAAGACPLR